MAKTIRAADLARLQEEGAEVQRERREIVVDGLCELRDMLVNMADAKMALEAERTESVLAAVRDLTTAVERSKVEQPDLRPMLAKVIETLQSMSFKNETPEYQFSIQRNSRNFMTSVTAKPVKVEH